MSEIKKNMTQGAWVIAPFGDRDINTIGVVDGNRYAGGAYGILKLNPNFDPTYDAEAICAAVNATYGAGIDPLKVGEMVRMLEECQDEFKKIFESAYCQLNNNGFADDIQNLLNSIKI